MLEVGGERLLKKTVQTVLDTPIKRTVVVLGANEKSHRQVLDGTPVAIIVNDHWSRGMGTSIKVGLQHLGEVDAAVILVCDQPLLSSDIILALLNGYQASGRRIIASGYSNAAGVPALFDKSFFDALLDIPDDQGAKKVISQHISDVAIVPFPGGEIDLDTMEDYERFIGDKG